MGSFLPAPGVYFAATEGEGVLLDLRANRYIGLDKAGAGVWAALAQGATYDALVAPWRDQPLPEGVTAEEALASQLECWREEGLLQKPTVTSRGRLPVAKAPSVSAVHGDIERRRVVAARLVSTAIVALVRTDWGIRRDLPRRGLEAVLCDVQAVRKARAERDGVLYETLRAYNVLRRFRRAGTEDCLPRSLALAKVLRHRGIDADVVFGVQKFPFFAHAWVEVDGRVINESVDLVRNFTVIVRF